MTPKLITLKDLGFDLVLAKAKVTDPKLRYRRQVTRYSSRGSISSIGRTILDQLQNQLGLSALIAKEIETEVLRPYQERLNNIQRYQQAFAGSVKHEYPLSRHVLSELEDLLEILGLRREDVDSIEQEIIAQTSQSSEAARQEYQQKLQRYEQELRRAVEAEYPLSTYSRNGLNDFQKSLGLKPEDVEQIERPILSQKHQQKLEAEELKRRQEQEKLNQEQEKLEYQRNLQRYEQDFRRAIDAEYPFSDYVRNGLRDFQKSLALKTEDIERIERPLLESKESEYRQKLETEQQNKKQEQERIKLEEAKLEYQRNLQRYEQEFRRALDVGHPFSNYVRNGLKEFQQSLGLKSKDVELIERPMLMQKETEYRQQLEVDQLSQQQDQEKKLQQEVRNPDQRANASTKFIFIIGTSVLCNLICILIYSTSSAGRGANYMAYLSISSVVAGLFQWIYFRKSLHLSIRWIWITISLYILYMFLIPIFVPFEFRRDYNVYVFTLHLFFLSAIQYFGLLPIFRRLK
jgi:hypothetical protein